ncbi:aldehyde dehydrogenase family protein [Saccharothrix australiensis]|uniref:Acyl-CoA reductase-like NAD-dependent aldehyde dehydrogenase n=1 Tax=Saccharothrix australiensis TaxID=2072 RepID=A0A495W340_9PSEU|nr:aldehyde dehydrogenase family protein [Saccharothrix australiensis]RKT55467.1 acyl-CoA reductase-like NAD-dependent aldehyde dehydrogenase [Saccharothrix australiensis]
MRVVDPIGPDGAHASRDRVVLADVGGAPAVDLGLAPPLLVTRTLRRMRAAPEQSEVDRVAAIHRAGAVFEGAVLDGESPEDYCRDHARLSGVPVRAACRALSAIRDTAARIADVVDASRPTGVADGRAVWARRGDVLGVLAPGNHPLPHALWLTASALGYRVAVRPSARDPLTAARLVRALHAAGLAPGHCALLPGPHRSGDVLVAAADLALVFGGAATVARHAGDPAVRAFGPGRSKVLVTAEVDWRRHLDVLVASVAEEGGTQCLHATTVLVEGADAAHRLAEALADRLGRLPALPPQDPAATLPVLPLADAAKFAEAFEARTGVPVPVADLGDGSAALRPVVVGPRALPAGPVEMPFPCVWVTPWQEADGTAPLRDSLALTLMTTRRDLVRRCLVEPTIRAVHWGPTPTTAYDPVLPHDGYLAEFLMTARASTTWSGVGMP